MVAEFKSSALIALSKLVFATLPLLRNNTCAPPFPTSSIIDINIFAPSFASGKGSGNAWRLSRYIVEPH